VSRRRATAIADGVVNPELDTGFLFFLVALGSLPALLRVRSGLLPLLTLFLKGGPQGARTMLRGLRESACELLVNFLTLE